MSSYRDFRLPWNQEGLSSGRPDHVNFSVLSIWAVSRVVTLVLVVPRADFGAIAVCYQQRAKAAASLRSGCAGPVKGRDPLPCSRQRAVTTRDLYAKVSYTPLSLLT